MLGLVRRQRFEASAEPAPVHQELALESIFLFRCPVRDT
jgi:hypothetical protein